MQLHARFCAKTGNKRLSANTTLAVQTPCSEDVDCTYADFESGGIISTNIFFSTTTLTNTEEGTL